jgi:hypothetical protein
MCGERGSASYVPRTCRSDPRIPLVTAIFPKPALAAPEPVEPVGQLDAHHIFCVLVAELPFDPRTQRGTMAYGERDVVETVGKNGLGMESVDEIDVFVIFPGTITNATRSVSAPDCPQ